MTGADLDADRFTAAIDMIARLGGRDLEITRDPDMVTWTAQAILRGRVRLADSWPDPLAATEELLRAIVTGDQCTSCRRPLFLGATALPGRCTILYRAGRYTRGCERCGAPTITAAPLRVWRARFHGGQRDGQTEQLAHPANTIAAPGGIYRLAAAIPVSASLMTAAYLWHQDPTTTEPPTP